MDNRKNRFLLVQSLLLDLIGFSLIFPVVPHLLDHYLKAAGNSPLDGWILPAASWLQGFLPDRQAQTQLIVLMGGVLASIYSLLNFLIAPFWGRLSDRIGRRPVLVMTSCGLALAYLVWFFSPNFTTFLISRVLAGCMAGNLGVVSAAMADMTDARDRTRAMGILGAAFGIGFILGPVIGGLASLVDLTQAFPGMSFLNPFSSCALVSVVMSIGSATLNFMFFKETNTHRHEETDDFAVFSRSNDFLGLPYVVAIAFLFTLIFGAFEFTLTFYYKFQFGLGPASTGFVFFYIGILIALVQGGLVRRLSGKVPEKTMALIGFALIAPSLVALAAAPTIFWSLAALLPMCTGSSLIRPSLSGLVSLLSPAEHQGKALGVFRSGEALGRGLGPVGGAYLYWTYGVMTAYSSFGFLLLCTLVLAIAIRKQPKPSVGK